MPKRITNNTKTDFIVNMTKEGFMRLCFVFIALSCVATGLSLVPYYLKRGTDYLSGGLGEQASASIAMTQAIDMIKYSTLVLMAFGFFGFLILLISAQKKYFKPKENLPMLLLLGYLLMSVLATIMAYDKNTAVFGSQGRFEGLVSIIAYLGFFLAASQLTDKKLKVKLVAVVVAVAVFHAVVGIFQSFEGTFELLPTFFSEKYDIQGASSEVFIANGFAGTPFALASLLTMATALCMGGFMYCDNKKLSLFFVISGLVSSAACLLTQNLAGVFGLVSVFVCLGITELVRIKSGHGLFVKGFVKNPIGKLVVTAFAVAAIFVILKLTGNFAFEDSYIVIQDSFYRLFLARPVFNSKGIDVYPHLWKDILSQIKDNFVFGMGPDCIGMKAYGIPDTLQIAGSADRAYNQYITMMATTGVVSLVFWLGFVAGALIRGVKGVAKFFDLKDNWTRSACFAGCVGYLVCAIFADTSVISTPLFFVLLGLCFSKTEEN